MIKVVRKTVTTNFTIIHNDLIRDKRLTFKARLLAILLLSNKDGFDVDTKWLAEQSPQGIRSVRSGLKELCQLGYCLYRQLQNEQGQWETEIHISDQSGTFSTVPKTGTGPVPKTGIYSEDQPCTNTKAVPSVPAQPFGGASGAPAAPPDVATAPPAGSGGSAKSPAKEKPLSRRWHPDTGLLLDQWDAAFTEVHGVDYVKLPKDRGAANELLHRTHMPPLEIVAIARKAWKTNTFCCQRSRTLTFFNANFNQVRADLNRPNANNCGNNRPTAAQIRNSRISGGELVRKRVEQEQRDLESGHARNPFAD